ncbi:MAG: peptide ABC transporter substrate-binding protein [Anaerolineae bacterium]|nr:peptide ABC transporter substrate-binding protein [Anaerolineae bacterium]
MFSNRILKGLTLALVFVLLVTSLISCAPSGEEETLEAPEPVEATEAPEPEEEETSIVIVIPEDPPSFNGSVTDTGYELMVMEMVLLGVAEIDPWGNVFPELAAELPTVENGGVVIDEDAWTMDVTWKLRDDIQWADGEPVTADDVVFTWDAISDPESGIWVPGADYTDSVEKIDDYTFVVRYNTVYPGYLTQLGGESVAIWPEHYCDAEQGFVAWDCNREPLSDGPYLLEEWVAGDHLTFVRNPNYFEKGKPYIDTIIVKTVPDASVRKTMTFEGDADVNMWVSESHLKDFEDAPNVKITISPTGRWVMRMLFNLAARGSIDPEDPHPILADVRVRKAIRMAIDVDIISREIFYGYSDPVWTEFFRPPYVCDIPKPKCDPEGAKALLEEAGWTDQDGDGIRECHGCPNAEEGYPMSMELVIYAEYGEELELAQQLMAEMLKDIGIETKLSMVEGGILWADYESGGVEQHGDFDITVWDDGYPGIDPTDQLWYFYYSEAAEPDYGWNVSRWINEDVDGLIDEAYTLDEEYRQELFCQMAEILDEELPQLLLFSTIDADGYSERLEGVQATINDIMTWNVADWKVVK